MSKFKDIEKHQVNPFIPEGIGTRAYITKESEELVTNTDTGEVYVMKKLPKTKQILHDSMVFTKVFKNTTEKLKNLSCTASNLFVFIINNLEINSQRVNINESDFIETFGYAQGSKRLYYKAVSELIERQIIAKCADSTRTYWINVNVLYNGDRTKI